MHTEVLDYVSRFATGEKIDILDIGGRDVNGTPRALFPNATYTVLDVRPGENVDVVADASIWDPDGRRWHLVVCTEVFEHTESWPEICATAMRALWPGGRFVATCAGPGRAPHSAFIEAGLQAGEFYANVPARAVREVLEGQGWDEVEVEQAGLDIHASARKPDA